MKTKQWISVSWLKEKAHQYKKQRHYWPSPASKNMVRELDRLDSDSEELEKNLISHLFTYLETSSNKKRKLYHLLFPYRDELVALHQRLGEESRAREIPQAIVVDRTFSTSLEEVVLNYQVYYREILKTIDDLKTLRRQIKDQLDDVKDTTASIDPKRVNLSNIYEAQMALKNQPLCLPNIVTKTFIKPVRNEIAIEERPPVANNSLLLNQIKTTIAIYNQQTKNLSWIRKKFQSKVSKQLITTITQCEDENQLLKLIDTYMRNPKNRSRRLYGILQDVCLNLAKDLWNETNEVKKQPFTKEVAQKLNTRIVELEKNFTYWEGRCNGLIHEAIDLHTEISHLKSDLETRRDCLLGINC